MRLALVTTTINVPRVLALYRKLGPHVRFFVAGDERTDPAAQAFCENQCRVLDDADQLVYFTPGAQKKWKCSELIGFNCIHRRNIAILEALKWGADVVVTIDDDNIPMPGYFFDFERVLDESYNGLQLANLDGWFDVGELLIPKSKHRGIPYSADRASWYAEPVTNAKVGVAAGICLGDPDVDAVNRIDGQPLVHGVSELLRAGVVVNPNTWTVFNSQNTAFLRELAPAMFLFPGVGRHDDIYASLFCQRIMRETGHVVHFGQPFVYQQRNPHDLLKDLAAELMGMQKVEKLAAALSSWSTGGIEGSVLDIYLALLRHVKKEQLLPELSIAAANAWTFDVQEAMK